VAPGLACVGQRSDEVGPALKAAGGTNGTGVPYCTVNANYAVTGIQCRHIAENKDGSESRLENGTHAPVFLTFCKHTEFTITMGAATGPDGAASSWPRLQGTVGIRVRIQRTEALEEEQQASGGGRDGAGKLRA
jgi:hypothetical protein